MTRTRMFTAMLGLVAVFVCSSLAGTEPNDVNTPLTFEISSTELPLSEFVQIRTNRQFSPWKGTVAYAAGIPYTGDVAIPSGRTEPMKSFALRQHISEEQQRFLKAMSVNVQGRGDDRFYTPPGDPNSRQILLHAVSLEDAKKMAQAFVQYTRDHFNQQVADHQTYIKEATEKVTRMQQRISELTQSEENTRTTLDEAKKRVPYRSVQQALDAAAELDKLLNTAQVEIAGIEARLKAIKEVPSGQPTAVATRLQIMRVEESISLQAAEARRHMATELRKQADAYMDLMEALPRITSEKESLTAKLPDELKNLQRAKDDHPLLLQSEPKVVGNKVFIYPIRN